MNKHYYLFSLLTLAGCVAECHKCPKPVVQYEIQTIEPVCPVCTKKDTCSNEAELLEVIDGDTIKILYNCHEENVRLLDIDCFETKSNSRAEWQSTYYHLEQDEVLQKGKSSANILKNLLHSGAKLNLKWERRDHYGRILGVVYAGELNVNNYMLSSGGCAPYVDRRQAK